VTSTRKEYNEWIKWLKAVALKFARKNSTTTAETQKTEQWVWMLGEELAQARSCPSCPGHPDSVL
jgi:hypothetical protein